jgi:hypothetical protein
LKTEGIAVAEVPGVKQDGRNVNINEVNSRGQEEEARGLEDYSFR